MKSIFNQIVWELYIWTSLTFTLNIYHENKMSVLEVRVIISLSEDSKEKKTFCYNKTIMLLQHRFVQLHLHSNLSLDDRVQTEFNYF